jgi:Xaa-Pro aminopeptidase
MKEIFYDKLFKETNYLNYSFDMFYNKIKNHFDISYNNSVTIILKLMENMIYYTNYKTNELQYDIILKKKYDLILFIDRRYLPTKNNYSEIIEIFDNIINNNLNKDGTFIFEMQILYGDDEITNKLLNNLVKNFDSISISYVYNPFISALASTIICHKKKKSNNIINQDILNMVIQKNNEAIEYNFNFVVKFLQFDDLLQKSIIYKLMSKF